MSTSTLGFATPHAISQARSAVRGDGALLIPQACSPQVCEELRTWIDADHASARCERHYGGTELRIWEAERHYGLVDVFRRESDRFLSEMTGSPAQAFTILAIRNQAIPADTQDMRLGRWHIDSFRKQLKVFLFLTPTTLDSGPFEYIPGTQAPRFKAGMMLRGAYFTPRDIFVRSRAYTSLPDPLIARLADRTYRPRSVLVDAGTAMIVDTSAIHRARPCLQGSRYALTAYYR